MLISFDVRLNKQEEEEEEEERNGQKQYQNNIQKCKMANTSAIWQQAVHTTYQLSSHSAQQEPYQQQKSLFLNEQCWRIYFLGEKSGEWTINRKITKTERAAAYMETDCALYMWTLPLTLNQFTSCACVRCLHSLSTGCKVV